jgi:hypothetical protein
MSGPAPLLPFQPATMSTARLAAVSYLARYAGRTHVLYSFQLRQWFAWCEGNGLDPLVGIQRAHVELYIRQLGDRALIDSSVVTSMHAVRGYFRFAHIDGLIPADPAVYARLPKVHRDESRTQGLDRLELIRFLQVAQTITVHQGALAVLLGINALRAFRSGRGTYRGLRRHPARVPRPPPGRQGKQARHHAADRRSCASSKSAGASEPPDGSCYDRSPADRSTDATPTGWSPGSPRPQASHGTSAPTRCGIRPSPTPSTPASRYATPRSWPGTPTPAPPNTTTEPAATSTDTASTS